MKQEALMARANIISEKDMVWTEESKGNRFKSRRKYLSLSSGGELLGCLYEVSPGKAAKF
jgi:hypothetical protein